MRVSLVAHRRVFHVNRATLKRRKANSAVVQVVQLEGPLERLSDCRTVPYLRFFLVRNEEALGGFVACVQRICAILGVHPRFCAQILPIAQNF